MAHGNKIVKATKAVAKEDEEEFSKSEELHRAH